MSPHARELGQLRRRAAGHRTRRSLWLLAALAGVSVLGLATAEGLTRLQMLSVTTLTGSLRDTARTQILLLPKGVAVESFLVRNGARAAKGQTLAWFNLASITDAIGRLKDQMAVDTELLSCLLAPAGVPSLPVTATGSANFAIPPADEAQPTLSSTPHEDCPPASAPQMATLATLAANDAMLVLRIALIDRRIKLEMAQLHGRATERDSKARLVLGLAWEQSRIKGDLAANQMRRDEIAAGTADALAENIRTISARLRRNQTDLAVLTPLQQDPRLISPVDAMILETNETAPDRVYDVPTALIRIVPIDPDRFEVQLTTPASAHPDLQQDAVVRIELIGTSMPWPTLSGHVTGLEKGPEAGFAAPWTDTMQVHIALEPESAIALAEMSARTGFVRHGSAIAVQLVRPSQRLGTAMLTAWAEAAQLHLTATP